MSDFLTAGEIIQVAVRIEKNGEDFYRRAAQKAKTEKVKELFNRLADEETQHRLIFTELLSKADSQKPDESYPGEYVSYLRAYVQEHIFTKEKQGMLAGGKIERELEALDFAMSIEIDSILFYLEARNFVPYSRETLDKILEEERRHYVKLAEAKKAVG